MAFTPNMSIRDVHEEDRKRGRQTLTREEDPSSFKGIDTPEGAGLEGDEEEDDMTEGEEEEDLAASIPEGADFGKPLPEKKKREGESDFQHKIRQWTEEVEDRPGRFPGGRKQAIAIAAQQSGAAKKALDEMADRLKKSGEKPPVQENVNKALSTQSMHIPRPRAPYDPFGIQASAMKATTRQHSALRGPEGVAPLVGETFAQLAEDEKPRTQGVMYKSCPVHGLSYRSDTGCYPCHLISKSLCKCGAQMYKTAGGGMSCSVCG